MANYPCLEDYLPIDINKIETTFKELFKYLQNENGTIWFAWDDTDFEEMAVTYYFRSFRKPLKTEWPYYFENNVDFTDNASIIAFCQRVATMVEGRFGSNLAHVWEAYFNTFYSPLENYDLNETRTPNITHESVTSRNTDTNVSTSASVVPFNDTTATKVNEGDSDTTESYTKNYANTSMVETGNETLQRHGNIGVTSSQQMLQQELDLRKLDFQELAFDCIDKVLFRSYMPID